MTVADLLAPQPNPLEGTESVTDWACVRLVAAGHCDAATLLRARRRQGVERYGVELRAHNGRDARVDVLQELVDSLGYAAQDVMEAEPGRLPRAQRRFDRLTAEVEELYWELTP